MTEQQGYGQTTEAAAVDILSRIRSLEGKYNLLRDRALIINNNLIMQYQKTTAEMQAIEGDIKEIKHTVFQIKETLKHVVSEMEHFARVEDLKVLEKYINLCNPMKFVTEEDVKKIIEKTKRGNDDGE